MKKLVLITILSLHLFQLSAQINWFEEGAKWDYEYYDYFSYGSILLEYQGDTIVNNLTLNKVRMQDIHTEAFQYPLITDTIVSQLLFYQEPNIVYQFTGDTLRKLYDFNLSVGDTLDYTTDHEFNYGILDSIGEIQVGNYSVPFQHINLINEYQSDSGLNSVSYGPVWVIEKIGYPHTFFLPDFSFLIFSEPRVYTLQCYSDNSGFSFNGYNWQKCENGMTTSIDDVPFDKLQISPNPTTDIIRVELGTSDIIELKVFGITGQEFLLQKINSESTLNVDMSNLNEGFYYLIGYDEYGNVVSSNKVIKN